MKYFIRLYGAFLLLLVALGLYFLNDEWSTVQLWNIGQIALVVMTFVGATMLGLYFLAIIHE